MRNHVTHKKNFILKLNTVVLSAAMLSDIAVTPVFAETNNAAVTNWTDSTSTSTITTDNLTVIDAGEKMSEKDAVEEKNEKEADTELAWDDTMSLNQSSLLSSSESAQQKNLREQMNAASKILGKYIRDQYQGCRKNIEEKIEEKGWNEEYTMLSFDDVNAPYAGIDCNEIVAAYTAALDAGKTGDTMLSEIPLIACKVTESAVPGDEQDSYGDIEFQVTDMESMYDYLGIDKSDTDTRTEAARRKGLLDDAVNGNIAAQNALYALPEDDGDNAGIATAEDADDTGYPSAENNDAAFIKLDAGDQPLSPLDTMPGDRKIIVATAMSLLGKIPYEWGGKPHFPGYDPGWWTIGASGRQRGLDCSGFVQWVFMTAGYGKSVTDGLLSTMSIRHFLQDISADELQPGDIGLLNNTDSSLNHTGIYLGNGQWIHCASGKHTVTVNNFHFQYFKRMPALDSGTYMTDPEGNITGIVSEDGRVINADSAGITALSGLTPDMLAALIQGTSVTQLSGNLQAQGISFSMTDTHTGKPTAMNTAYTQDANGMNITREAIPFGGLSTFSSNTSSDDVLLISKLVEHEAGNQGFNGWAAVAEVVKNRIQSPLFPNTASDVIFQHGQFTDSQEIVGITPRREVVDCVRQVMNGTIKVLGNSNVLYFRNPYYVGLKASENVDWQSHKWFTSVNQHAFYLQ